MALGCVKKTLDPTGRYEVLRYGQTNQRVRLNAASVTGTSLKQLQEDFGCSVAVTLYMRLLQHARNVFLVLFCCGAYGSYQNFRRASVRNDCRGASTRTQQPPAYYTCSMRATPPRVTARLEHEYEHLTSQPSECGYQGLPIREDAYMLHVPPMLRLGIGGCEEYNSATVQTMPRGPPNPFVDTPAAAFCANGASAEIQGWFGFVIVAVLVGYLVWLRWFIQRRGGKADRCRLTAADYAISLTGLRRGEEIDGEDGLRENLAKDLEELGFAPRQIDHIAVGANGRNQIKLLRQLGGMNVQQRDLATSDEEALAKLAAKREKLVAKFEKGLEASTKSTGHAVIVFRAESDRDAFQEALEKGAMEEGSIVLRSLWASETRVLSRSRSPRAWQRLDFEAAPEPEYASPARTEQRLIASHASRHPVETQTSS